MKYNENLGKFEMNRNEQLLAFYTTYNTMSAEEQQYMETGFIELLSNKIAIVMISTLLLGIFIGHVVSEFIYVR